MTSGFVEHVKECLEPFGATFRRMFGGYGIYGEDGRMFALIADDALYFKADAASKPAFEAEGSEPFAYESKGGKKIVMSYWLLPEHALEDRATLAHWVESARAAAARADGAKRMQARRAHVHRH